VEDAGTQAEIEWDGGGGGAEAVLGLARGGTSVLLCYHQAYGPHDDLLLLEAVDELLPDLLQGR
jgi:sister chromatid cohesion protein DCC1